MGIWGLPFHRLTPVSGIWGSLVRESFATYSFDRVKEAVQEVLAKEGLNCELSSA